MKNILVSVLRDVLGRDTLWRLGRYLYMKARLDSPNKADVNGEELLQKQLLARFSNTGETLVVFDVGANIGNWTWFLLEEVSRLDMKGGIDIHTFEPVPTTFAVLQQKINTHKLRSLVHLNPLALSKEEGLADMYISGDTAGTNSLHPDAQRQDQQRIAIEKGTVDSYCSKSRIPMIHYIKCDTEGHDMEVLYGAKRLFDNQKLMAFQFEYNSRWVYSRHFLKDVFDAFEGTSYNIGKLTPDGVEIYPEWHPELEKFFEGNYIVLHPEATYWFTTIIGKYNASNTFMAQQVRPANPHLAALNRGD